MKQLTGIQSNECTASQTSVAVSKPCDGLKSAVTLDGEQPTTFLFTLADVKGYDVNADGSVTIHFKDTSTLTIPNFQALADAGYSATLQDGTIIEFANMIDTAADQGIKVDFTANDIQSVTDSNGKLVIVTKDGERHVYEYSKGEQIIFADGSSAQPSKLEDMFKVAKVQDGGDDLNKVEPAAGETKEVKGDKKQTGDQQATAEQLAAVEPAAGGTAPAGGIGNTGAGFGSRIDGATIGPAADVGPIGPTSLAFGVPTPQQNLPGINPAPAAIVFPNAPSVDGIDKTTLEDNSVQLQVTGSPSVVDGSERITVEIIGIPSTWTVTNLQGGVYDSTTGIWTIALPPGQTFNGGPIILPPVNSDVDLPLVVRVTTTNVSTGLSTSATDNFSVIVDAVADTPTLSAQNVTRPEDTAAPLTIAAAVTDTDGSESITLIRITGIPAGFTLNAGTLNADGSYTVLQSQLATLTITPPTHFSGTINPTVEVTVRDNPTDAETTNTNNELVTSTPFSVTWTPVADAPVLLAGQQQVLEDGQVTLATSATLVDRDGSESMVVEIVGIPNNWSIVSLNGGTYNAATQTWSISIPAGQDFNGGPRIAPPADSDVDLPLVLRVTTTDGTSTAVTTSPFTVIVDAVADNVNLTAGDVSGMAGQTVPLSLNTSLKDIDGSEEITSITLFGIPAGAALSAGTRNADGSWSLTQAQFNGALQMTLPTGYAGSFDVTVRVDSRERVTDNDFNINNNTATLNDVFTVTVTLDAVPPTINVNSGADGQVYEDGFVMIPVYVIGNGTDQETIQVTITGLPTNWNIDFSAMVGAPANYNPATGVAVFNLPANTDLGGTIRFAPPVDSDIDTSNIRITAVATEPASGDTADTVRDFVVEVDAVADVPILMASAGAAVEDQPINLTINAALDDRDGSEVLSFRITGLPVGATLNMGTQNPDGSWTVLPTVAPAGIQNQIPGLQIIPPFNFSGTINLSITAIATETNFSGDEFDLTNNVATYTQQLTINVTPVADDPSVVVTPAQVYEDQSVVLNVQATQVDPSESLTVKIGGLLGWNIVDLNGGTYNAATGEWSITTAVGVPFNGGPRVAPNADSDINRNLPVTVTTTDGTSTNSVTSTLPVVVDAVADNVNLTATGGNAQVGGSVAVAIATSLKDTDGSEEITSITITGVPAAVTLSAGTRNADGSWSLTQGQLAGLTFNGNTYTGSFTAVVTVNSRERVATDSDFDLTNNTASNSANLTLSFAPNPPVISINGVPNGHADGQVYEDNSVLIPVSVVGNGSTQETMVVTIAGLPAGWTIDPSTLTGGTIAYTPGGSTITVTLPANTDLGGAIRFTPPANSDVNSPVLTVTAVATEPSSGLTTSDTETFTVVVDAVADNVNLTATGGNAQVGGSVAVAIATSLKDTDGSEEITSIRITGVPAAVTLSAGTRNADGSWSLTQGQLAGLTFNGGAYSGSFTARVTVESRERVATDSDFDLTNNTASNFADFNLSFATNPPVISINGVPNGSANGQVLEDNSVVVPVSVVGNGSAQETMVVTISGLPAGWTIDPSGLTGGAIAYTPGGSTITVTLPANTDLSGGIRFTPPANSDIDSPVLTVSAVATEPGGFTSSDTETFRVIVDAVADNVNLTATGGNAQVGGSVAVAIATSLKDTDGSEEITSIRITGVPAAVTLSAGTHNADGSWSLTQGQLAGLTFNGGTYTGSFTARVTVDSRERVAVDSDFNLTNNTASNFADFNLSFAPNPPVISINGVPNGSANGQVLEDNSVLVPVSVVGNGSPQETMVVTISGFPAGWTINPSTLTGGTVNYVPGATSLTVTLPANTDLGGAIRFTPPANSDVDSPVLTVSVVATEPSSGLTTTDTETFRVIVDAVADHVNLSAVGGSGAVNSPVAVTIATSLKDTDGSEEITSITITGIPSNVTLSAGTRNPDGSYSLTAGQLAGLTATSNGFLGTINAVVTVNSRERVAVDSDFDLTNNTASDQTGFSLVFNPTSVPPTISINGVPNGSADGQVYEDNSVFVPVSVVGNGSAQETMVVTITNLPAGWGVDVTGLTGGTPIVNGTTVTISLPANTDLGGGIRFTPPANSDVDSPVITVHAVATEPSTGTNSTDTETFRVVVDAVADLPNLTVANASGNEDTSIPLTISSSLVDTDGSETLSIRITGVPTDASLSAGTRNADGSYTLTAAQLAGLRLTPAANYSGTINLTVYALAHENANVDSELTLANNDASRQANLTVTVNPIADTPTLTTTNTSTPEDTSVTVVVTATPTDPSESLTVTITNITNGWTVTNPNGGTFNSTTGTWIITLPPGTTFTGGPTLLPPPNSDVDRTFPVTVTSTDGTSTTTTTGNLTVIVDAVVDTPTITVTNTTVPEDNVAPISITTTVGDTDGSERVTEVRITGIPAGFTLNHGTLQPDGSWVLTQGDLAGLTITAPANYSGTVNAVVRTTIYDQPSDNETTLSNNTAVVDRPLVVTWTPVADTPVLNVAANQQVLEDGQVTLAAQATLVDRDGSESMRVDIVGIPSSWTIVNLNGGTYNAATQTWSIMLAAGQDFAGGPRIAPPHDSDVNLPLTLVATTFDGPTSTATTSTPFNVIVDAVWDGYNVSASGGSAAVGNPIAINIGASAIDIDGSEHVTRVTITGIPAGVTLNHGALQPDGSWVLTTADLAGLTASSGGFSGTINAVVRVDSAEALATDSDFDLNNNAGHNDAGFTLVFNNVPTGPFVTIDTNNDCVFEDTRTLLPFSANFGGGDGDEVMTITVTGLPSGWTIDTGGVGTLSGGTWTITLPAGQHNFVNSSLFVTPPSNSDFDYNNIQVTASLRDPNNGNAVTTDTKAMPLEVDAVADGVNVATTSTQGFFFDVDVHRSGNTNTVTFASPFSFTYRDGDGSESITSIVATGPAAQYLSNLYINGSGQLVGTLTWTGNRFTPPDFTATLRITTTDTPHDSECTTTNNTITQDVNIAFDFANVGTPLVLDLDGNGIHAQSIEHGVQFDMNNDGVLDRTAWLSGGDAFLAIDLNHDGVINNQSELFGESSAHRDGFGDLATYDSNGDGRITAEDSAFGSLLLWRDLNGDGVSQSDEMFSLADFNIASIDLNASSAFDVLGGDTGVVTARSTYTTTDGVSHEIADVAFVVEMGEPAAVADAHTQPVNEPIVNRDVPVEVVGVADNLVTAEPKVQPDVREPIINRDVPIEIIEVADNLLVVEPKVQPDVREPIINRDVPIVIVDAGEHKLVPTNDHPVNTPRDGLPTDLGTIVAEPTNPGDWDRPIPNPPIVPEDRGSIVALPTPPGGWHDVPAPHGPMNPETGMPFLDMGDDLTDSILEFVNQPEYWHGPAVASIGGATDNHAATVSDVLDKVDQVSQQAA